MMIDNKLKSVFEQHISELYKQIPGVLLVTVFEIETGNTIVDKKNPALHTDVEKINKLQSDTIKLTLAGNLFNYNQTKVSFDDLVVSLEEQTHVFFVDDNHNFITCLFIDNKQLNIILAKAFYKQSYKEFNKSILSEFGKEHGILKPNYFSREELNQDDIISLKTADQIDDSPKEELVESVEPTIQEEKRKGLLARLFSSN